MGTVLACLATYVFLARLVPITNAEQFDTHLSGSSLYLLSIAILSWVGLIGIFCWTVAGGRLARVLRAYIGFGTIFLGALGSLYFAGFEELWRMFFLLGSVLFLPLWYGLNRAMLSIWRCSRPIRHDARILIIGSKKCAQEAIAALRKSGNDYDFVGCLDPDESAIGRSVSGVSVIGTVEKLSEYLFGHPVDLVLITMPLDMVPNARFLLDTALDFGVPISALSHSGLERFEQRLENWKSSVTRKDAVTTVTVTSVHHDAKYLVIKRLCDIAVSGLLLVFLSPLFVILMMLVKLTSPRGPIFYRWRVLGQHRRPFVGYKFRTMIPNADELKDQLMHENEMIGPVFKMRNDPRVTALGKFLRKYSLDELPQLYSVLKGDMSLVGPRPPSKKEADQFKYWQRRKLCVRPGITCLWQINGRNEIASFDEWAKLDLEYIKKASLSFDFKILVRTIPAVICAKGAH
jgi:exopolysaccharide biosynthesis polyprenyl glycosylphosphotransferase